MRSCARWASWRLCRCMRPSSRLPLPLPTSNRRRSSTTSASRSALDLAAAAAARPAVHVTRRLRGRVPRLGPDLGHVPALVERQQRGVDVYMWRQLDVAPAPDPQGTARVWAASRRARRFRRVLWTCLLRVRWFSAAGTDTVRVFKKASFRVTDTRGGSGFRQGFSRKVVGGIWVPRHSLLR